MVDNTKEDILYIVHRIPYPPNKGDKIRSFNILKYLSQHYRVHLATFIDDPKDRQFVDSLDEYSCDKLVVSIDPLSRKLLSLAGLLTGEALSNRFYRNRQMQSWVSDKVLNQGVTRVVLFSSPMAQFVSSLTDSIDALVMDFVDVDSEKWFQYAEKHAFPMSYLYRREGRALRAFEARVSDSCRASVFVSNSEAELFKQKAPVRYPDKVIAISNGVDTDSFNPKNVYDSPFKGGEKAVVFTGAMDYWANIDAVKWFCKEVWPRVRSRDSNAVFYIVGSKPVEDVLALEKIDGVKVTGFVQEVQPYLAHCHVCVAPLRIARGIQNKVLEALSMSKVVVATPEALEGIVGYQTESPVATMCSDPDNYAQALLHHLSNPEPEVYEPARSYVEAHFSWESHLSQLDSLLES
ncbi:MAG: sugar transferase [Proteobacteria bacterium]|nr:MAG: sugar transferase [Pseudomonadota bacterium]